MFRLTDFETELLALMVSHHGHVLESSWNDCRDICHHCDIHEKKEFATDMLVAPAWLVVGRLRPFPLLLSIPFSRFVYSVCFGFALGENKSCLFNLPIPFLRPVALLGRRSSGVLPAPFGLCRHGHLVLAFDHQAKTNLCLSQVLLFTLSHNASVHELKKCLV